MSEGYHVTDDNFFATALTLRSWLPGDLLLGTVERALREALKAHCIPAGADTPQEADREEGAHG